MRDSSVDFFTFFKKFGQDIDKCMPKVEKRRAGAKPKPKATPLGGDAALQAELKAAMEKRRLAEEGK